MSVTTVKTCRHGPMAYLHQDIYVGQAFHLYGEYGEEECQTLLGLVGPGDVVIDAGANVGAFTVPLARKVGHTGRVHAFEPQRIVHQVLCANVVLNNLTNVYAHHAAVGAEPDSILVPAFDYRDVGNYGGVPLGLVPEGERVPVVVIDALDLQRLALIKADVEGMEQAVVSGARETIERCRPVLYLEADRLERNDALIGLVKNMGYRVCWHTPPLFSPQNYAGNPQNVFGDLVSINILAMPNEREFPVELVAA